MCLGFPEIVAVQHRQSGRRSVTDKTDITPTKDVLSMSVCLADVIMRKDGQSPVKNMK